MNMRSLATFSLVIEAIYLERCVCVCVCECEVGGKENLLKFKHWK